MLSWDVIVLNGYLLLNVHICGYLLYCRYQGRKPAKWFYIPFVFIAIVWAVSIHTVTAFLYVGLGGRPFWNSAIVGPRFLASAFTAGPALIILALQVVRRVTAIAPGGEAMPGWAGQAPSQSRAGHARRPWMISIRSPAPARVRVGLTGDAPGHPAGADGVWSVSAGDVLLRQGETDKRRLLRPAGPGGGQARGKRALTASPAASARANSSARSPRWPARRASPRPSPRSHPGRCACRRDALRKLMKTPQLNKIIHARMAERLMITDRA